MTLTKIVLVIALTMVLSIALTIRSIGEVEVKPISVGQVNLDDVSTTLHKPLSTKLRTSRFLAENVKNPRAADHCRKDNEVCDLMNNNGTTYHCCNNKCIDLSSDKHNCGACKNKCPYTHECCRGECVLLSLDKRHCGACNKRCPKGEFCVYGMCNYA